MLSLLCGNPNAIRGLAGRSDCPAPSTADQLGLGQHRRGVDQKGGDRRYRPVFGSTEWPLAQSVSEPDRQS
jgi:hypothetical protein